MGTLLLHCYQNVCGFFEASTAAICLENILVRGQALYVHISNLLRHNFSMMPHSFSCCSHLHWILVGLYLVRLYLVGLIPLGDTHTPSNDCDKKR